MMKLFIAILATILFCGSASGQSTTSVCSGGNCVTVDASNQTGAYEYAVRMNQGRFFRHDPAFRGPEVIFRSSGQATEQQAHQAWMNSPPHRRLVVAGLIQDVQCVGSVCVGRGVGLAASGSPAAQPIRHLAPLKSIRVRLKRCR